MAEKDEMVQRAKLAEQAERYDDMASSMKVTLQLRGAYKTKDKLKCIV